MIVSLGVALLLGLSATGGAALAETPRERKEAEERGGGSRPAFDPSPGTSQQQERQDRARPAPIRERRKPGESQQDVRKRHNKDRALSQ